MFRMPWNSTELVNTYNYLSSGHFFDANTMRFFKSRLTSNFKRIDDSKAYFVTTECNFDGLRLATIRQATLVNYTRESDGRECQKVVIETVGDFHAMTLAKAKTVLKGLV